MAFLAELRLFFFLRMPILRENQVRGGGRAQRRQAGRCGEPRGRGADQAR